MKYGVIPTTLTERLALLSGKVPVPMIDALFGPLKTRAIMAAVRLGVFEAMRDGEHTPAALAATLHLDPDTLELLLRGLVVCDYVRQRPGDRFALSSLGRRSMIDGAPMEFVGFMRFNYRQWEFIEHLEDLVRTGRGVDFHETMTDADSWRDYQRAMLERARFDAPIVASRVPVRKGATNLLDVAGSHGLFGAAICRRHPPMRSTVIDLPQAVSHARALASAEKIDDVVTHREGDLFASDLGSNHDVVLLLNILHHFTEDRILSILDRVRTAMRGDGTVAVWEIEAPKRGSRATSGDGVALFFRLASTAGAYHGDQYAEWMRRSGFDRVAVVRPSMSPGNVLVTARL